MSVLQGSLPLPHQGAWRQAGALVLATLVVLVVLYRDTLATMVALWNSSETYTHGYIVLPITLWLLWRRRRVLAELTPAADARALAVLGALGIAWLLADAASVNVVAQYAFVGMLIAAVWAVLGHAFLRAALFPLMFLLFAVPAGEFLIRPLMDLTANMTVALLQLTGVPVYREGTFFSLPSGDWSVVEACSGLRYLTASITLGALYAYLSYRSWRRRALFVLAAALVPVLANGIRAYLIVMIGHLSDMQLAVGIDHILYGWVFFGLVMLGLFWVGSFWQERDDESPAPHGPGRVPSRSIAGVALIALLISSIWPVYGAWLAARPLPAQAPLAAPAVPAWETGAAFTNWAPHWVGADRKARQTYARAGDAVLFEIHHYVRQRPGAELVNSRNLMVREDDPQWANVGERVITADIGGSPRRVRQAKLLGRDGQRLLVWQWNLVDGAAEVNPYRAAMTLAFNRVLQRADDGAALILATPYQDNQSVPAAAAALARFAGVAEPAARAALAEAAGR